MKWKELLTRVIPERLYSVCEAARILGVHRCTIYTYITHPEQPLPFVREKGSKKLRFRGADLMAYKTCGLPKRGRKSKM